MNLVHKPIHNSINTVHFQTILMPVLCTGNVFIWRMMVVWSRPRITDGCGSMIVLCENWSASIVLQVTFCLRDNSVHVDECSPFWVGIFIIFEKKTTIITVWCRHTLYDWQSSQAFLYVIGKSNIKLKWTYYCPWYSRKTQFSNCAIRNINKGANSYKLEISKIGNCCTI